MKKIMVFFMVLLFWSSVGVAKEIGEEYPPLAKDSQNFLFYSKGLIVLPNFSIDQYKNEAKKTLVFKVSTLALEKYGLKAGVVVQSVDFQTGRKNPNFIVRDYVYARWPKEEDGGKESLGRLHIILSYDDKVIDEVVKNKVSVIYATGIAYLGLDRKLYESKESLYPVAEIGSVDFKRESWNPKDKNTNIYFANIFNNTLFIRKSSEELSSYEPILKTPSGYFGLTANGRILTSDRKNMRLVSWGKDEKLLILSDSVWGGCSYVYIIGKVTSSYIPLPCSNFQ